MRKSLKARVRFALLAAFTAAMFLSASGLAAKPLAGLSGIMNNSPRTANISPILEGHLVNVLGVTGLFDMINVQLFKEQIVKFNCLEERCLLRVAGESGMGLFIRGELDDRGDYIILRLFAYGMNAPYHGRMAYRYIVNLPIEGEYGAKEYSYIMEEHAGYFISGLLKEFRLPVQLLDDGEAIRLDIEENIDGPYDIFRRDNSDSLMERYKIIGRADFTNSRITGKRPDLKKNDFVLLSFKNKSKYFADFYYGRKKEIVFNKPSAPDTIYTILFAGPASAVMPILSPLLGYYRDSDWLGLTLWTINYPAYLYLMLDGFINNPDIYKRNLRDIPRESTAGYSYSWYMLFAGGFPLFVDSFAHQYLKDASNYQGIQPLMGNSATAAFAALIGGGGGHFYRGERMWGYFYYHLNNILLYFMIRELTPSEKFDPASGSYVKQPFDPTVGYALAGVYAAVKVAEIIHAVLIKDRIRNGDIIEEGFRFEPLLAGDRDSGPIFGLQYSYRF